MEGLITQHLDLELYHLIKLRASQINGCAYCLAMHTDEALKHGETPERIVSLDAWEESPLYSDRERAALAWTEELTLIADSGASKERSRPEAAFHRRGDPVADLRRGADQQLEPDRDLNSRAVRRARCSLTRLRPRHPNQPREICHRTGSVLARRAPAPAPGAGQQVRFGAPTDPFLDFDCVVEPFGNAAAVGEAEVLEFFRGPGKDLLEFWCKVVAARKVEAHRTAATAAILAVALAQGREPLFQLLAANFHGFTNLTMTELMDASLSASAYRSVSYGAPALALALRWAASFGFTAAASASFSWRSFLACW